MASEIGSSMFSPPSLICEVCQKTYTKLLRCSGCDIQKYCAKKCQRKDWPKHKKVCLLLIPRVPKRLTPPVVAERLSSPFKIKKWWLYNEWNPRCQFSWFIKERFSTQGPLHPETGDADENLVAKCFHEVRGQFALWGPKKEKAKWIQIKLEHLKLIWVAQNVNVLYPVQDQFEVTSLYGLVLWKEAGKEKYDLIEGNHRISAWQGAGQPASLPAVIFIGEEDEKSNS